MVLLLPITQFHFALAYIYTSVFKSKVQGYFAALGIAFIGTYLGCLLSFLISRYCIRDTIKKSMEESENWRETSILVEDLFKGDDAITIVVLLRLMFIPKGLANYVLGATSVSFFAYAIGSVAYVVKLSIIIYIGVNIN